MGRTYINTYEDFQIEISSLNIPVVACFYVEWCCQYKKLNNILKNTLEKNECSTIFNINILNSIKLVKEYNIISSPTVVAFYNKKVFWRESGEVSSEKINRLKFVLDNVLTTSQLH